MNIVKIKTELFEDILLSKKYYCLIGNKVGVIKPPVLFLRRREEPVFTASTTLNYVYSTQSYLSKNIHDYKGFIEIITGSSAGLNISDAINKAISETIERYSLTIPRKTIFGNFINLKKSGKNVFDPDKIKWFANEQYASIGFPFKRFLPNTNIRWCEGINLITKEKVFYPAQQVFIYTYSSNEEPCVYSTSSGCAAAPSMEEAILKSIYEFIERDAVMITWYSNLSPPKIELKDDYSLFSLYCDRFENSLLSYTLFDISTDVGVPVVLCILKDESNRNFGVVVSAASDLSPKKAILKALIEAAQGLSFIYSLIETVPLSSCDPYDFTDFIKNVRYYGDPSNIIYFSTIMNSSKKKSINTMPCLSTGNPLRDLKCVISLLKERKLTPICFNLTPPEAEKVGIYVVRTIIPELVPLGVPKYPFLGNPRLYTLPKALGYTDYDLTWEDLNKNPHPFP